ARARAGPRARGFSCGEYVLRTSGGPGRVWTSWHRSVVESRGVGARLDQGCEARLGRGSRAALPRALAPGVPGGAPRDGRRRRRGGHRAGGVPRRRPQPRPLRPPPAVRAVAAPHRRQPRDRLDARAPAAVRGRAGSGGRRPAGARGRRLDAREHRGARARAPGRRRPALRARVHARRDRGAPRPAARHRQLAAPPRPRPTQGARSVSAAEERAWEVVRRAYVERPPQAVGVEHADPAIFSLPAKGRLLVVSAERGGIWLVHDDGYKRRIGAYDDAEWSPHGLHLVATRRDELVALDPDGTVHWSLARREPRWPRWEGTRTDTRIAYVARSGLRVVAGDGTGDTLLDRFGGQAPPAWDP